MNFNASRILELSITTLCISFLVACGGGGGGSSQFSLDESSLSFSAREDGDTPQSQTITGRVRDVNNSVFIFVLLNDPGVIQDATVSINESQGTGTIRVFPKAPGSLGVDTHRDTIQVRVCNDSNCNSQLSGSPRTIDITYVVEAKPDRDNDGTADELDEFPDDPSEQRDTDGDGTGDNADAFPTDSSETTDSDNDGTGDNADDLPNDPSETTDSDGDGTGNNADAFPNDASEQKDTDSDGVGDNADEFPENENEHRDSDNDGVGSNSDDDDSDPNITSSTLTLLRDKPADLSSAESAARYAAQFAKLSFESGFLTLVIDQDRFEEGDYNETTACNTGSETRSRVDGQFTHSADMCERSRNSVALRLFDGVARFDCNDNAGNSFDCASGTVTNQDYQFISEVRNPSSGIDSLLDVTLNGTVSTDEPHFGVPPFSYSDVSATLDFVDSSDGSMQHSSRYTDSDLTVDDMTETHFATINGIAGHSSQGFSRCLNGTAQITTTSEVEMDGNDGRTRNAMGGTLELSNTNGEFASVTFHQDFSATVTTNNGLEVVSADVLNNVCSQ